MNTFCGYIFTFMVITMLFLTSGLTAQDTIHLLNKKKIIAKVLEINTKDVVFRYFDEPSGPKHGIDKRDVVKIVYANGIVDTFNVKMARIPEPIYVPPAPPPYDPRAEDYFQNFAYLTATDLLWGLISVGYERTIKPGKISIRVPFSFGMTSLGITKTSYDNVSPLSFVFPSGAYYFKNKIFSTGIELNCFPNGQGTKKYFWGPAIEYGQYNYYTYTGVVEDPGKFIVKKNISPIFTIMLKNGVLIQPTKKFNLAFIFGIGSRNLLEKQNSKSGGDYFYSHSWLRYTSVELGVNVGYKF